jgi:Cu2+-exporting ATPase
VLTGLTVLIVSCPCALGLATPLAVASGLQSAAASGIVVATPALFEHSDEVDTLVLDKTGTITDGEMAVTDVTAPGDADEMLARASALEAYADHPIGAAVADAGAELDSPSVDIDSVESQARGITGTVDGDSVLVGHRSLFAERDWDIPAALTDERATVERRGDVPVVVGWGGRARGLISVGDTPRDDWEDVVTALADTCRIVVLTGDDSAGAQYVREHPAIDEVFAGVPPDGKAETVRRLAADKTVAMVGDGSNDAPALAAADVGIALESGTKLATDAADAVVLEGDIRRVPTVFSVAERTNRRIRENLAWAFLYNGVAIPLAITGYLNPLFAAVAMATSSLFVVANSARAPNDESRESDESRDVTPSATNDGTARPGSAPAR